MPYGLTTCFLLMANCAASAIGPGKPNTLTPQEIADGWISLFDGETTYGWKTEGTVSVKDALITLGGDKASSIMTTSEFGYCKVAFEFRPIERGAANAHFAGTQSWRFSDWVQVRDPVALNSDGWIASEWHVYSSPNVGANTHGLRTRFGPGLRIGGAEFSPNLTGNQGPFGLSVSPGGLLTIRSIKIKPLDLKPIFDGKSLSGWKVFPGDKYKSKFTVTPEGWLNVKDGPGDLQTEKTFADFIFQGECISNGPSLNSGIFFRCLPNQYQQGYEMQISNKADPKTGLPADYGTGAIYRRIAARKLAAKDGEWFAMTLNARGNHIATWVNGFMTVDWTDNRKPHENPRQGSRAGKGHLSIQGHDPTTDLSFRNFRIGELHRDNK